MKTTVWKSQWSDNGGKSWGDNGLPFLPDRNKALKMLKRDERCRHGKHVENPCWECDEEKNEPKNMSDEIKPNLSKCCGAIIQRDSFGQMRCWGCSALILPTPDTIPVPRELVKGVIGTLIFAKGVYNAPHKFREGVKLEIAQLEALLK